MPRYDALLRAARASAPLVIVVFLAFFTSSVGNAQPLGTGKGLVRRTEPCRWCRREIACGCADRPATTASIGGPGTTAPLLDADLPEQPQDAGITFPGGNTPFGADSPTEALVQIGNFLGGGLAQVTVADTVTFEFPTQGFIISGVGGSPNALLSFEMDGSPQPGNDFFSTGVGMDLTTEGNADLFNMTEPLPPNEVPTSPGPGYVYTGGTVRYTNNPASTSATPTDPGIFDDGDYWLARYSYARFATLDVPVGGLALRQVKIADNNSPFPQDRLYFNHNFYNDVFSSDTDINRYTFGVEKTFYNGMMSLDLRAPFAGTFNDTQYVTNAPTRGTEFGNLTLIYKAALYRTNRFLFTGGMAVGLPTARDTRVILSDGSELLRIRNESVHLTPYLAAQITRQNWYVQGFAQLDIDANGNRVSGSATGSGGGLPRVGVLQDPTLFSLDISGGYVLYRNPRGRLNSIVPIAEFHYTEALQGADVVSGNGLTVAGNTRQDVTNLTFGAHILFGSRLVITPGMVIPVRNQRDRQFDFESAVLVNYRY